MDSTKTIVMPTLICLTLVFIIYYRFYSKKSKKISDESKSQPQEEKKEEIRQEIKKDEEKVVLQKDKTEEIEEEEEEEEREEIGKEKDWKMTFNYLFDKFCEYIQKNKLVSVDAISEKLHKSKEETIKFLRELEKEGKTQGFLGEDGEYFFLTMKELELLNNLLITSKKSEINEEELIKQFDEILKERDESLF